MVVTVMHRRTISDEAAAARPWQAWRHEPRRRLRRSAAARQDRALGEAERPPRLPHSRAGKSYFWTDADIEALLESMKVRPHTPAADTDELRPLSRRQRS
jgi:hypothetical protein